MAMAPPRASSPRMAARLRYWSSEVMRAVDSQTSMNVPDDEVRELTASQAPVDGLLVFAALEPAAA